MNNQAYYLVNSNSRRDHRSTATIQRTLRILIFKDVRCETRIHIKGFKRSLVKNIYLDELSTASLQSSTGRLNLFIYLFI